MPAFHDCLSFWVITETQAADDALTDGTTLKFFFGIPIHLSRLRMTFGYRKQGQHEREKFLAWLEKEACEL